MTREAWERSARGVWEDAYRVDPALTMEVTLAVTGAAVIVWTTLKLQQLRDLHRRLFATARFL